MSLLDPNLSIHPPLIDYLKSQGFRMVDNYPMYGERWELYYDGPYLDPRDDLGVTIVISTGQIRVHFYPGTQSNRSSCEWATESMEDALKYINLILNPVEPTYVETAYPL